MILIGRFTVAQLRPNLTINFGPNFDQVGNAKLVRFQKLRWKSDSGVRFAPPTLPPTLLFNFIPQLRTLYNCVNNMPKAFEGNHSYHHPKAT